MKSNRPKLALPLTLTDKITEALSFLILAYLWISVIAGFNELPEIVPTHYNASGEADGYSEKSNLWIMPTVATIVYVFITAMNFFPHLMNYPINITQENAEFQYRNMTLMNRVMKLSIMIVFTIIVHYSMNTSTLEEDGLPVWFVPFILGITIVPSAWFVYRAFKKS